MSLRPFHLAFPVHDLAAARAFWGGVMGCPEGRSSDEWIDFDFFGHQIVAHLAAGPSKAGDANPVDGHDVPVPHFGIEPYIRFKGQTGEQATMFFLDPSGNAIEMKGFPGSWSAFCEMI